MPRASARVGGALLLLCLWLGGACTPETDVTQLLVVVDSDLSIGMAQDALKTIQVRVLEADGAGEIVPARAFSLSDSPQRKTEHVLPLSFALTPSGADEGALFRIVVTGLNGLGEEIAERQSITAFRTGAALRLDVVLAASCLRELCRTSGQRSALTCDRDTGCSQIPVLKDLPTALGSGVGGYVAAGSKQDGAISEESDASAGTKCESHAECDDARFCNGSEECDPGSVKANRMGCVVGMPFRCGAQQTCDEANDRCTSCALLPDGDGDRDNAIACGGRDCNDGDPAIASDRSEVCDGKDNDCDELTDTRAGVSVCPVIDGGADAGPGAGDAGMDSGIRTDGGIDAGATDAGKDAGPSDAGMEASVADSSVPLTARCSLGSTQACSSFINVWDAEVAMGSYGSVMEPNVGRGFEVTVSASDTAAFCSTFVGSFGLSPSEVQAVNDLGTLNLSLHTIYRPARWLVGEKYPLIVWGNGQCMQPETYGAHLRALASQGFIVIAPNSRSVAGGALGVALDFAFAANAEAQGPYSGRIDTTKVGVMGHAAGAGAAITLASDPRVQGVLMFSGGRSAVKPFLGISADRDLAGTLAEYQSSVSAATKAAYIFFHMVPGTGTGDGNLLLVKQPARVTGAVNAWWKYLLNNDTGARNWFVGASCTLCGHASDYDFGQNGLVARPHTAGLGTRPCAALSQP